MTSAQRPTERMLNMHAVQAFVTVADHRSFRRAADFLILDASTVSKLVRNLEQELGVPLLHRTTRRVWLTEHGAVVLRRCRDLLDQSNILLAEIESRLDVDTGGPSASDDA